MSAITFDLKVSKTDAWDKLQRTLQQLAHAPRVKVGFVGERAAASHGKLSNAELGAVLELGSPKQGVPARSYLRAALEEHQAEYGTMLEPLLGKCLEGKLPLEKLLARIGEKAAAHVREKIIGGPPLDPPLSPKTLAAKKKKAQAGAKGGKVRDAAGRFLSLKKIGNRPLVETGQLVAAISYEVELRPGGGDG